MATNQEQLQAWVNGTPTGGPNGDGRYPLTYADGTTHLVLCPRAQALTTEELESIPDRYRILAEEAAEAAAASETAAAASASAAAGSAAAASNSATSASSSKTAAATSETNAATSATNAANSATAAATSKSGADSAKTAAETAKTAAETAKTAAQTAQTAAETARGQAQTHATNASGYADAANTSKTAAANSALAAEGFANLASTSAVMAGESESSAQLAAEDALSSKEASAASATAAADSATAAQTARSGAEAAQTGLQEAKTAAEAARDLARKWASNAVDVVVAPGEYSARHWAAKAAASALSVDAANLVQIAGSQTITGRKTFTSHIDVQAAAGGNAHLWLRDDTALPQGLLFWDRATDSVNLRRYNAAGDAGEGQLQLTAAALNWNGKRVWDQGLTDAAASLAQAFTVKRFSNQYTALYGDGGGNTIKSLSDIANAKPLVFDSTTDEANTASTAGAVGIDFKIMGANALRILSNGAVRAETSLSSNGTIYAANDIESDGTIKADRADAQWAFMARNAAGTIARGGIWCDANGISLSNGTFSSFVHIGNGVVGVQGGMTVSESVSATGLTMDATAANAERQITWNMGGGRKVYIFGNNNGTVGLYDATTAKVRWSSDINNHFYLDSGNLFFGSRVSQQINLYGSGYGMGVQNNTTYIRSGAGRFSIFQGGVHSDTENDPGTGGQRMLFINMTHGLHLYNGWFRSQQSGTGWYHEVHGGGWHMNDAWIRNYNNKVICISTNQGTVARWESPSPTFEFYDTDEGYTSWLHLNGGTHGFLQHNSFAWGAYRTSGNEWHCVGNIVAYASDGRLKKNVKALSKHLREAFFSGIEIEEYDWDAEAIRLLNPGFHPTQWHEVGAIAQKVEKVYAGMVHTHVRPRLKYQLGDDPQIKTLMWEKATPFLVAQTQEHITEIATLNGQVADLTARVARLEKLL